MANREPHTYVLNAVVVDELLARHHLSHGEVARQLEICASYWSLLVNGHRRLTARMRHSLRAHKVLGSVDERALWTQSPRLVRS
jgi:plasmid maintenance system antidote protein VapI